MFSGPMSESVPSSVISFAHRRSRQNSTVSFTYFQQGSSRNDLPGTSVDWDEEEAAIDIDDDFDIAESDSFRANGDDSTSLRLSKTRSTTRASVEDPLLTPSDAFDAHPSRRRPPARISQRIYIVTEDMHASITGFSTSVPGFAVYVTICVLTVGLAYLLLRWLPKWRVRLVGKLTPLGKCEWVAIEVC
jgi:cation-transporting P-type ATPase 13A2